MHRLIGIVSALCVASAAVAQVVVTPPTSDWRVTWVHAGTNVDHYEVRTSATASWVNAGTAHQMLLPLNLASGSYAAQVRACAAGNICSAASPTAPFTVPTVQPQAPAVPTNVTVERIATPVGPTCAPSTQTVTIGQAASFSATGGTPPYAWTAPGGSPATGSGAAFSTTYPTSGSKTVTVGSSTCAITVDPTAIPTGTLLFTSGWETALGCNDAAMLDGGAWSEYGGSGACSGAVHDADVVTGVSKLGANSLRITQKPGTSSNGELYNGTDFRALRRIGDQREVTLIAYVKYDTNYRWASADHKIFIFMGGGNQNVYINYRGGSDGSHARLCAASAVIDAVFCASSPQVTLDTWYRLRVHLVAGQHGTMEIFLQPDGQAETKLNLVYDAGTNANINDLNTGAIDTFKIDTTYNAGSTITQLMFMWYDAVSVYSGLVN